LKAKDFYGFPELGDLITNIWGILQQVWNENRLKSLTGLFSVGFFRA
jgi:hypothetical protein